MFLALREMRHAKSRYALIAAIMLLISFLVLFVTGLAKGLAYANISALDHMKSPVFAVQEDAERKFRSSMLDGDQLSAVRAAAGEENADWLGVQTATLLAGGSGGKLDVTLFGIDMKRSLAPEIAEGHAVSEAGSGEVVADLKLKESGARIGGKLEDPVSGLSWTIAGFVRDYSYSHTPVVFLNSADWLKYKQATSGAGKKLTSAPYNAIALTAGAGQNDELARAAKAQGLELLTKNEAIRAVPGYAAEQNSLLMMIVFLFVISAFVLAVFFYVITIQKTGQFGILKAMGTRTGYLGWSVLSQVLTLSVVSIGAGTALTLLVKGMLPEAMPFRLEPDTMLLTGTLFLGVAAAGSLVSVLRVARIDALDAIGRAAA
ncbi:ABC transporter permease [Paenibacillus glufosinatiresistens]|uniref:ABC transporter permease n=1 Tax=Paenibacillus glufosinatiresistens TaxID=3070657 RepID=UPI00286EAA41|nr:ABC transporter permease [Paenibacillus sp. YX.27]